MILSKIVLVFCGVAISLAVVGDLAMDLVLNLLIRNADGVGIGFDNIKSLNRIPIIVLSLLWFFALLLGWVAARRLGLIARL